MSGDARDDAAATSPARAPVIPDAVLNAVYAEARAAFPDECCGWLSGPAGDTREVDAIRPCVNVQDTERAAVAGRSAETAFTIEGKDLFEFNQAFDGANPPRVIYHSHPNGRAYFSATDQHAAVSPFGDGPAYDVLHLVVGIDRERVTESALFAWSEGADAYVEIARFPGPDARASEERV